MMSSRCRLEDRDLDWNALAGLGAVRKRMVRQSWSGKDRSVVSTKVLAWQSRQAEARHCLDRLGRAVADSLVSERLGPFRHELERQ